MLTSTPVVCLYSGWTGCQGISLTEVFQILNRQPVAEHMQQGIQQCRAVSCGKNKSVSVIPVGVCRVYLQLLCPQGICRRCRTRGSPGSRFLPSGLLQPTKTQGIYSQLSMLFISYSSKGFNFFFAVLKLSYFLGTPSQSFKKSFNTDVCKRVLCHLD